MESNSDINVYASPAQTKHTNKYTLPVNSNLKDKVKDPQQKTLQTNPTSNPPPKNKNILASSSGFNNQQMFNNSMPQSPLSPIINSVSLLKKDQYNESNQQEQDNQNTLARLLMFQSGELNTRDFLSSNVGAGSQYHIATNTGNQNAQNPTNKYNNFNNNGGTQQQFNMIGDVKYINSQYMTRNQYEHQSPEKNKQKQINNNQYYNYVDFKKDKNSQPQSQQTSNRFTYNNIPLYESEYQFNSAKDDQTNFKIEKKNHDIMQENGRENQHPMQELELSRDSSKGNGQNNYVMNSRKQFGYSSQSDVSEDTFFTFIVKLVQIFTPKVTIAKRQAFQALFLSFKLRHSSRNLYSNTAQYEGGYNKKVFDVNTYRNQKQNNKSNAFNKIYGDNYYKNLQQSLQKRVKESQRVIYTDELKAKKNNQLVFQYAIPKDISPPGSSSTLDNQGRNSQVRWNQNQNGLSSISSIQGQDSHAHSLTASYNLSTYNYNNLQVNKRKHVFAIQQKNQAFSSTYPAVTTSIPAPTTNQQQRTQMSKTQQKKSISRGHSRNSNAHNYDLPTFKIIYQQQQQSNANTNSNITPSAPRVEFNLNSNVKVKVKAKKKGNVVHYNGVNNDQNQYHATNNNTNTNTNNYEENNRYQYNYNNTNANENNNSKSTVYDCYYDYATNQYVYADGTPENKPTSHQQPQPSPTPQKNPNTIYSFTSHPYPYNTNTQAQIKLNMKQLSPILIKMGKCPINNQAIKLKIEKPLLMNIMNKNTPGYTQQESTLSQLDNLSSKVGISTNSIRKQKIKQKLDKLVPITQDTFIKQIINTSQNDQMVYMLTNNNNNNNKNPQTYADDSQQDFSNNGQQQCLQFYQEPEPDHDHGQNQSQQLPQNALKLQSNSKVQKNSKNASIQNFNIGTNVIDEQSKSSSNIVYINVGHPLKFDKLNIVNKNHVSTYPPPNMQNAQIINKQGNINTPNQRPTTSYITNTHSVIFQNANRAPSPKNHRDGSPTQRPATYNPNSNMISSFNPVVNLRPVPINNLNTGGNRINISPSNKISQINSLNSTITNTVANTRVQLVHPTIPQTPINQLKKPISPVVINTSTISMNKNPSINIVATSPPRNVNVRPQNNSPTHIKIIRQNKQIPPQNKKVFITYNDKNITPNNSNIKGQPLIHIPRPMSQPSLRPVSAFSSNIRVQNSLQNAQIQQKQHNQKVHEVRADYYGSRPVSPPKNIIINNKIVGQLHSPPQPQVLRQCKSSPNLVKINYVTPINYGSNINSSRNITNNTNNSPFQNGMISIQQARPTSPQTFIKIQSPRIQTQQSPRQIISLHPNPVRPASSIPTFSDTGINNAKVTANTVQGAQQRQQIANINNQKSDKDKVNVNNGNTGGYYDNRSASKKQRPQSMGIGSQSQLIASGKSISVYNYVAPQTEYNLMPRQSPNQAELIKPGFNFNNHSNPPTQAPNTVHPIYREYHDQQQSGHRPGSNRKKLNVVSRQQNQQLNAYGLPSGSGVRSPTHKNI